MLPVRDVYDSINVKRVTGAEIEKKLDFEGYPYIDYPYNIGVGFFADLDELVGNKNWIFLARSTYLRIYLTFDSDKTLLLLRT